jgi:hypothetical protein
MVRISLVLIFFTSLVFASSTSAAHLEPFSNPGVAEIENPKIYSRALAVSDVHGMYDPLRKLLRENLVIGEQDEWIAENTLLVVVGDSIDKGPASLEVLDLWISLQRQAPRFGGAVLHVLGNHEAELLADPDPDNPKFATLLAELSRRGLSLEEFVSTAQPYGRFLRSEPLAARIGRWLFCHSGFYPDIAWKEFATSAMNLLSRGDYADDLIIGPRSILELKEWWKQDSQDRDGLISRLDQEGFDGVVFGHMPKALGIEGQSGISTDGRLIKIDNGMAPSAGSHPGSLLLISETERLSNGGKGGLQAVALVGGHPKPLLKEHDERRGRSSPL